MSEVTITLTQEKLETALNLAVEEVFKSSYRNPFVDIIQEELKKQDSVFREVFNTILSDVITNPDFKKQLGDLAMQSLVAKALKS
jgi:hypothetical protein